MYTLFIIIVCCIVCFSIVIYYYLTHSVMFTYQLMELEDVSFYRPVFAQLCQVSIRDTRSHSHIVGHLCCYFCMYKTRVCSSRRFQSNLFLQFSPYIFPNVEPYWSDFWISLLRLLAVTACSISRAWGRTTTTTTDQCCRVSTDNDPNEAKTWYGPGFGHVLTLKPGSWTRRQRERGGWVGWFLFPKRAISFMVWL